MARTKTADDALIRALRRKDEQVLAAVIDKYTPYVGKVVWNVVCETLTVYDAEEIIADVFIALWKNADRVDGSNLKGYLGKIARNKGIDALRRTKTELSLEENAILLPCCGPEQTLTREEQSVFMQRTLNELPEPERSIFIRHYYLCQTTGKIASDMQLNVNTVQSKLKRGREKLRGILQEGGYFDE